MCPLSCTYAHIHKQMDTNHTALLPSPSVLHTSFILLLIPYKMQTRCPFTSHRFSSAYLLPPSRRLSFLPSFPPSFLPSQRRLWRPSRRADMFPCLLWCSGIRFTWSPRSGTNNLFNPLIIIRGINKFGWETEPWTLNLYPSLKFIFLPFFPVAWCGKVSHPLSLCLSVVVWVSGPCVKQIH